MILARTHSGTAVHRAQCRTPLPLRHPLLRSNLPPPPAPLIQTRAIRGVESHDGAVILDSVSQDLLTWSMSTREFSDEVVSSCGLPPGSSVKFTGRLFQPVPWSPTTKYGMPQELEVYRDKSKYAIIQVPPKLIMQAMIKNIPRIAAIFEICDSGVDSSSSSGEGSSSSGGDGGNGSSGTITNS